MKYTFLTAMMLCASICQATISPTDGLWSTTDDPAIGSGLILATQNGITVVSVFTYDEDGNNVWYVASGQINDGGVLEVELRESQNGTHISSENPVSAEFVAQTKQLSLDFKGSQLGSLSIDGSVPKEIKPQHFSVATTYGFPDITGQWVVGNPESGQSYVLDVVSEAYLGPATRPPVYLIDHKSTHPSTEDWAIGCVISSFEQQYCFFNFTESDENIELKVSELDIGNENMVLIGAGGEKFQAFRLNKDRRLLPNDGYWRAYDDPAIGSGLVMRTQGSYTVVLIYTYDETGQAIWQLAAGQFDENGLMVADLNQSSGGTAIENESPMTAEFTDQMQRLEIQLQGLELATFSIDGSEPKAIQNYNYGVELYDTEQVKVMGEPLLFPNQDGHWVVVSNDLSVHDVIKLAYYSPNCCISPRLPWYSGARGYDGFDNELVDGDVILDFICTRVTAGFLIDQEVLIPYCEGYFALLRDFDTHTKTYFEDIGFNEFRQYYGLESEFDSSQINRDSDFLQLFRLEIE